MDCEQREKLNKMYVRERKSYVKVTKDDISKIPLEYFIFNNILSPCIIQLLYKLFSNCYCDIVLI